MQKDVIDKVINDIKPQQTISNLLFAGTAQEIMLGSAGQEKFCRLVAAGFTHEKAYEQAYEMKAGDARAFPNSQRLMRQPHIVARVMQLRASGIKGFSVTRDVLIEPLLWALNTARDRGATDQVRKIVMDIGKLFGLVVDKLEADISGQFQIMRDVQVDGSSLVFDIGSGNQIHLKGEAIEGRSQSAYVLDNPQDTITDLDKSDDLDLMGLLENEAEGVTGGDVLLVPDELPIDAMLDGPAPPAKRKRSRLAQIASDEPDDEEAERRAAWGSLFDEGEE